MEYQEWEDVKSGRRFNPSRIDNRKGDVGPRRRNDDILRCISRRPKHGASGIPQINSVRSRDLEI